MPYFSLTTHCKARKPVSQWRARKGKRGHTQNGLCHCCSVYRGDGPQTANIKETLKEVLKTALFNDGVCRGLREAVKALDKYVTSYTRGDMHDRV